MPSRPTSESLQGATRELLLHALYEAAELEHNLMCTYLYAAFSLKSGVEEGLNPREAVAGAQWRREILSVAVDEMSHLTAVWNITSALGGVPRFGRTNFPLDPGYLPAGVVVKLAPFNEAVLQHFIYLERPAGSVEPDGKGFAPERLFVRGTTGTRLTPMGIDYGTVGEFYGAIGEGLRGLVQRSGESTAFCGDPALQLSEQEIDLPGARRVVCLKTALAAFDSIVRQGEGAPDHSAGSHFDRFSAMRTEYQALLCGKPGIRTESPGGSQSGAAPTAATGGQSVDRVGAIGRHGGPGECGVRADAASDRVRVCGGGTTSGQGARRGFRGRSDARDHFARRARGAPAGGSLESGLQCRGCPSPRCEMLRHCRRGPEPAASSSSVWPNWRAPRRALTPRENPRLANCARAISELAARAAKRFDLSKPQPNPPFLSCLQGARPRRRTAPTNRRPWSTASRSSRAAR